MVRICDTKPILAVAWLKKVEVTVSKSKEAVRQNIKRPSEEIYIALQLDFNGCRQANNILDK